MCSCGKPDDSTTCGRWHRVVEPGAAVAAVGRERQDIFKFRSGGGRGGRRVSRPPLVQTIAISLGAGFVAIIGSAPPHPFSASVLQHNRSLFPRLRAPSDTAGLI